MWNSILPTYLSLFLNKKMIHAIMIINKSGGLIYNKDFGSGIAKLTSNEYLILAGTFHGIHAITCNVPTKQKVNYLPYQKVEASNCLKATC
jgi:hypothetical protein